MGLTKEQAAAVADTHPFVSLVAPAGSGKTHTLAEKVRAIRSLHTTHQGTRVAALTFTNRAAGELHERTEGAAEASTFHGFAIRIRELADSLPFTIYDERDQQDVAVQVGLELGILHGDVKDFRKAAEKVIGKGEDGKPRDPAGLARYRTILRRSRAVDFDMLIEDAMRVATETPLAREFFSAHHFMLDEQQDADPTQWALVNACAPVGIFMVGDPRQTIYTWRDADPRILLDRWGRPPRAGENAVPALGVAGWPVDMTYARIHAESDRVWHAHALTACFRSKPAIVQLANRVAEGMTGFDAPPMVAHRTGDADVAARGFETFDAECQHIATWAEDRAERWTPESGRPAVMILARSWRRLQTVREILAARGVGHEYLADSGHFWGDDAAKNSARHLALCVNPASDWIARQLTRWPFNTTTAREMLHAQEVSARNATPLAIVLGALHPERFGYWRADLMAEIAAMPDAGAAMDTWLRTHVNLTGELEAAHRTRNSDTVQQAIARCKKWAAGRSAAGLPTTPRAFGRWLAFRRDVDEAKPSPIWLSTVHGVKGLEADHVAVTGLHSARDRGFDHTDDDPESRRLFFVAATRARDGLLCTYTRTTKGRERFPRSPGMFWQEAQQVFGGSTHDDGAQVTGIDLGVPGGDRAVEARAGSDFMAAALAKLQRED